VFYVNFFLGLFLNPEDGGENPPKCQLFPTGYAVLSHKTELHTILAV
jgi:hypothetical protein